MWKEFDGLVDEVRLSFHALVEFTRRAHGHRIDPPGRAVLEYLSKNLPSSVPTMARSRGVTRQHIQTIVNDLESRSLVEASMNPAHMRSPLFALTAEGRSLIESITRAELDLVEPFREAIDPGRLVAAARTLADVRAILAGLEHES